MASPIVVDPSLFNAEQYNRLFDDRHMTAQKIIDGFSDEDARKIKSTGAKLEKVVQTVERFKKDGEYDSERTALHNLIVHKFLSSTSIENATPADGQPPTFILLGGRGGSGKSWFKNNLYDPSSSVVLDADEIKLDLPEYQGWNAYEVHEESADIFDAVTELAQDMRLNLVHDSTMKTPSKTVGVVREFIEIGYRVEVYYMYLPRQEAAKRAVSRFLGGTGRFVPINVVLDSKANEISFDRVRPHSQDWNFWDNNVAVGQVPQLVCWMSME
jgi:predicted ABC-type ATPase